MTDRSKLGMSRRELLETAAALGVSVSAIGYLPGRSAFAQAKAGGHFRLGLAGGATTDTLDPSSFSDTFMAMVGYAFRGNLTEVAPDGSAVPELSESFEGSEGAKKWVFKLRKGVEFSNGKSVTVEDVIASINHHRGSHPSANGVSALLKPVDTVKADGSDTVIVMLKEGNTDFPYVLSDYAMNIMPFVGDKPDLNVGAGPYKLTGYQPGVRATFEKSANSYKKGHFDSVEMLGISDPVARENALAGGQVDVINRPDLKTARLLGKRLGIKVEDSPSRKYYSFAANGTLDPFSNLDVRLALKYAIDRETLVKKILFGHGSGGNDQPITPSYRFYAKDLAPRAYDPERAKFHLKKAGLKSLSVELSAADAAFPGAVDASLIYADDASKANITIKSVRESDDGYWDKVWMKRPFCATFWGGRPTEDAILTVAWSKGSSGNEGFMSDDRVDMLMTEARVELDEGKRRKMYEEIQHLISDNYSVVIPMFAKNVHAMSAKVTHPEILSGSWELDGARCIERWWFTE